MSTSDVQAAITALQPLKDDQLYAGVGQGRGGIGDGRQGRGDFSLTLTRDAEALGLYDDFRAFGREFFIRVNHQAYGLVCGSDSQNKEDRQKIEQAAKTG